MMDSALKISSTKIISAPIPTDSILLVPDVYKHFDKQPQLVFHSGKQRYYDCLQGRYID